MSVLFLSYLAVFLVDILNFAGSRKFIEDFTVPLMWNLLFKEASLIEYLQWTMLVILTLSSAFLAYKNRGVSDDVSRFWAGFALAGMLMFLEDTIDVRNYLLRSSIEWSWKTLNILETFYFLLLGLVPLYFFIKYRRTIYQTTTTLKLLIVGFLFYGMAAFISGPADLTSFNYHLSNAIFDLTVFLGGEELELIYNETDQHLNELRDGNYMSINYRLVDFLVEESLELIGATFLASGAVSYLSEDTPKEK